MNAVQHCATHPWYPATTCQGSHHFIRWDHPLLGPRWSCIEHAIQTLRSIPDAELVAGIGIHIAPELRQRARTSPQPHPS